MMLGVCRDRVMSFSFQKIDGEIINMSRLGSKENPIRINVHDRETLEWASLECLSKGWKFVIGMNPDEPEDLSDLEQKLNPPTIELAPKIGRNEICPCGSGKKYKKCCLTQTNDAYA
jgi:SWIM/SEC-C metal-binding protein